MTATCIWIFYATRTTALITWGIGFLLFTLAQLFLLMNDSQLSLIQVNSWINRLVDGCSIYFRNRAILISSPLIYLCLQYLILQFTELSIPALRCPDFIKPGYFLWKFLLKGVLNLNIPKISNHFHPLLLWFFLYVSFNGL